MKKSIKLVLLGAITLMMVACASQKDQEGNNTRQEGPPSFSQILSDMDTDKDGKLSQSEAKGPIQRDFSKIDTNDDGFISQVEFKKAPQPQRGQRLPKNN